MTKGVMGFVKGVGMGLAVGCVAGAVGNTYMHSNKKGIKKNRNLTGNDKGNCSIKGKDNPRKPNGHKAFALIDGGIGNLFAGKEPACRYGPDSQGKIDQTLPFPINEGNEAGKQH